MIIPIKAAENFQIRHWSSRCLIIRLRVAMACSNYEKIGGKEIGIAP